MKKLLFLSLVLLSAIVLSSCSKNEVGKQETKELNRKVVDSLIQGFPFYVSKAYKITGSDTVDVLADTVMQIYQNNAYLTFFQGFILFYSGQRFSDPQFPAPARTFHLNTKITLPANMDYHWDDNEGTIVVETRGNSSYFPFIPAGKTGYLDKNKFNMTGNFEEAKNAVIPPSITFIYEDYVVELKPMWLYFINPDQRHFRNFVAF